MGKKHKSCLHDRLQKRSSFVSSVQADSFTNFSNMFLEQQQMFCFFGHIFWEAMKLLLLNLLYFLCWNPRFPMNCAKPSRGFMHTFCTLIQKLPPHRFYSFQLPLCYLSARLLSILWKLLCIFPSDQLNSWFFHLPGFWFLHSSTQLNFMKHFGIAFTSETLHRMSLYCVCVLFIH